MVRRTSHHSYERIDHLIPRVQIVAADLLDQHSLTMVLQEVQPDEVYNLAAQSFVPTSFTQPVLTGEFTALGVTRILEAVRLACPEGAFLPGVVFRDVRQGDRDARSTRGRRSTRAHPTGSPSSTATGSRSTTASPTDSTPSSGILFNHESPRRGMEFVTRKVTRRGRTHHSSGSPRSCGWATSRRGATGATRATTSMRCGGCCSRNSRRTS